MGHCINFVLELSYSYIADEDADTADNNGTKVTPNSTPTKRDLRDRSQMAKTSYVSLSDQRTAGLRGHAASRCVSRCVRINSSVATYNQSANRLTNVASSSSSCACPHKVCL